MRTQRHIARWALLVALALAAAVPAAQERGAPPPGRGGGAPPSSPPFDAAQGAPSASRGARAGAPIDLTGTWVSLITEDWRYRIFTPPKGDYASVPINAAGRKAADAWDAAKDEAAGEQCRAYGAAGLMRMPTRLRVTWQDDRTLKLETDAGTQTRLFHFGAQKGEGGDWQGISAASWDYPRPIFPGRGAAAPPPGGALKVTTTRMRAGYLRKNGVPYSASAAMTEYFARLDVPGGDPLLVISAEIVDPEYLATPYWTSVQFRRQNDASGWNPTPCVAR